MKAVQYTVVIVAMLRHQSRAHPVVGSESIDDCRRSLNGDLHQRAPVVSVAHWAGRVDDHYEVFGLRGRHRHVERPVTDTW